MPNKTVELRRECKRLSESCLYSSTSLYIWIRERRRLRSIFTVVPLVLGSVSTWKVLTETDIADIKILVSICSFVAGLLPSLYAALKYDDQLEEAVTAAAGFKSLQDRFRQAALVASKKPFDEFEAEFKALMDRLDLVLALGLTAPERHFRAAQRKVKSGDYTFDVDTEGEDPA